MLRAQSSSRRGLPYLMKRYRQIVEKPCRVLYRIDGETVYIVHVMRGKSLTPPKSDTKILT